MRGWLNKQKLGLLVLGHFEGLQKLSLLLHEQLLTLLISHLVRTVVLLHCAHLLQQVVGVVTLVGGHIGSYDVRLGLLVHG